MTGKERVVRVLSGQPADGLPVMPIVHTALARYVGVPLGRYFTDADVMADVIVRGQERFGFDGVQLTLGVAGEVEALGARVDQPPDGGPIVRQHLLAEAVGVADPSHRPATIDDLRRIDPAAGGRMPMYHAAVRKVVERIGRQAFVLSTLRGPLNIASQLCGVENILIDLIERPDYVREVLAFATDVAIAVSRASLECGADGLAFGEATCSPNFISPEMYLQQVQPWHVRLIAGVKEMGWRFAGLHVCGGITPILDGMIATGVDFLDVDYQVPAAEALRLSRGRVALRGNLNPSASLFLGTPDEVRRETAAVCLVAAGSRWILSSGCDIPAGTPAENLATLVETARLSPAELDRIVA